jgi:hypothetical protein
VSAQPTATAKPAQPSGLSRCENACRVDLNQVRMTWYDGLGLDMQFSIRELGCPQLTPEAGEHGTINTFNWLNTASVDTGLSYTDTFVMDSDGAGTTSNGGDLTFSRIGDALQFKYTLERNAIARADAGFDGFPSVFEMCVTVGDQEIYARLVCQPKRQGLLCHEG